MPMRWSLRPAQVTWGATLRPRSRWVGVRRTSTPTRWRALPTLLVVLGAMGLGAVTARADDQSTPCMKRWPSQTVYSYSNDDGQQLASFGP